MESNKVYKYSLIAGWAIVSLAILFLALLFVAEENRSPYFWPRVIWSEVLFSIFWGGLSAYFLAASKWGDSSARYGGITLALSFATCTYAILSFVILVAHAYLANSGPADRWHLAPQIILFAGAATTLVFLSVSRAVAADGLSFDHAKGETPKALHDLIAAHETELPNTVVTIRLRHALKALREAIVYSINEHPSLLELADYRGLCNDVKTLCGALEVLDRATKEDWQKLEELETLVVSLKNRSRLISAKQARR